MSPLPNCPLLPFRIPNCPLHHCSDVCCGGTRRPLFCRSCHTSGVLKQEHLSTPLQKAAMLISQPSQRRPPLRHIPGGTQPCHFTASVSPKLKASTDVPVPSQTGTREKTMPTLLSLCLHPLHAIANGDVSKALAQFLGPPQSRCAPF